MLHFTSRAEWERILWEAGFCSEHRVLSGKGWYEYYPLYACRPYERG